MQGGRGVSDSQDRASGEAQKETVQRTELQCKLGPLHPAHQVLDPLDQGFYQVNGTMLFWTTHP